MSVFPTWVLQMYLSGAWVDISADVRQTQAIACEYGIRSDDPNERVAETGKLTFGLNNSARNSAATLGYYSPLNASKRTGYDFNAPVRWKLTYGSDTSYKFRGKLSDINPTPGLYGPRDVPCTALDWMDDAASIDLPDLATQLGQREDELVTTILDAMDSDDQPAARSIETGLETFPYALDGGAASSQRPKVRDALIQIARSSFGHGYPKGDATQGGTFMWENRRHRAANPTVQITLSDADCERTGMAVPSSRDDIISSVQVFVRPTKVDASATTVLYSLQSAQTLVQPGETNDTLFGPYRDPTNNDQIGGTAQVNPVATTDYTMNAAADGSGADLTANFTVTASFTGLGVRFPAITNAGPTAGYITKLQVRGKGIYRYDAMIEVAVPGAYGTRPFVLEMPFQNSTNVGADIATYLSQILSSPFARVKQVRFLANKSASLMSAAILREPGDRIALSETVTGINAQFTINGVGLELQPGGILYCTWWLESTVGQQYWLWGIAGSSEWGTTTVYGF